MEIAIISEQLFKDNGPVREDAVIAKFVPYIILAQKMYIEPLIGRTLMKRIQQAIYDNQYSATPPDVGPPIPDDIQALILEIAPCLSFYAVYQGLPFHWAGIQNKGVTIANSENSEGITWNDLAGLRAWLRTDAQSWATTLLNYLKGCRSTYPEWVPPAGCDCDEDAPKTFKLDFGINIPKPRRRY